MDEPQKKLKEVMISMQDTQRELFEVLYEILSMSVFEPLPVEPKLAVSNSLTAAILVDAGFQSQADVEKMAEDCKQYIIKTAYAMHATMADEENPQ